MDSGYASGQLFRGMGQQSSRKSAHSRAFLDAFAISPLVLGAFSASMLQPIPVKFATPATPRPRPLVIGDHGSVVGHEIFVISSEITRIDDDDDTNSRGRWIVLIFNTIMITSWRKEME